MNPLSCRPLWLAGPALALGALLAPCSSEPKATDPSKTAEVVSDTKTVDVTADSAGATRMHSDYYQNAVAASNC